MTSQNRRVLMVAYHFPPFVGSSGVQRTVKFCRYLREFGWDPAVLTVEPRAYVQSCEDSSLSIPEDIPVHRSFCLDTARHLAILGRHPGMLALPDRWVSWWPSGIRKGLEVIREWQPGAIWSTYPVATAHLIGRSLARRTGLPWIADFRDWMTDTDYPAGAMRRALYRRIERGVLRDCDAATFTTQGSYDLYAERYPALASSRWSVIPNGFDESDFQFPVADAAAPRGDASQRPFKLLHSGFVYPEERNPAALIQALGQLKAEGTVGVNDLRLVFRGAGSSELITDLAARHGVFDLVETAPLCAHQEAVEEMAGAHALVLMQGERFVRQVPAKAYEYLRLAKPVLTLSPEKSESRRLMEQAQCGYGADLTCVESIAAQLRHLVADLRQGTARQPDPLVVAQYSRRNQTGELAVVLDELTGGYVESKATTAARANAPRRPIRPRRVTRPARAEA